MKFTLFKKRTFEQLYVNLEKNLIRTTD